MNITKEQSEELMDLSKPIIKWLNDNVHPHTHVIITPNTMELSEGIHARKTDEFIKD